MSRTVADLAVQLRSALSGVLSALGALEGTQRRAKLAEALGLPGGQLTPAALLSRLGAPDADQAGELWPALLTLLGDAADQAVPDWNFTVPDLLAVTADQVQILGETVPADGTVSFAVRLGPLRLATVLHVRQDAALTLTAPPAGQAATAALSLALSGVRLTLPDDPLVGLLAPGGVVLEGDVQARLDAQGARFQGGGKNGVSVPLRVAPPGLRAPTLSLAPASGSGAGRGLRFTASFGASLLELADGTIDGIGGEVTPGGTDTPVRATGLGLSLEVGPARGAGFLERRGDEYGGALELALGVVDVRAFAILRPRGPSLLVALSAHFTPPIELGLAFTLNAVGGILGIGHAIDRAALGEVVRSGHLDRVLFPDDAARAAPQILSTLASVFPARRGSVVVGPMLRLGWGRPISFVTADLGIVLELPSGDIALLGRLRVAVPAPEAPVLDLRASLAGFVDSGAGLAELVGDLAGSRLLTSGIDGGIAVRLQSGSGAAFVLSAGGFHPGFPVPAGFPTPRPLSLTIADSPFLRIVFTGYFALTPGTIQAGAALSVVIGTRDTGVSGRLGFDALVRWEPSFGVVLDLYGSFHLRFDGMSLCSVDLRVRLEGPTPCWHVAGRASVSLFFIDVEFPFDEHWGCTAVAASPPVPDIAVLLERELDNPRSWEPVLPEGATALVTLRRDPAGAGARLLHPLGRLRFSQRVIPLDVEVTRFGPGRLPGPPKAYGVDVRFATGTGTASPVREQFARADFFDLTDDEKLTQPAFEALPSGSELTPPVARPTAPSHTVDVRYETKWIGERGEPPQSVTPWLLGAGHLTGALLHSAVATSAIRGDRIRYHSPPVRAALKPLMFAVAKAGTLTAADGLSSKATFTEASELLRKAALGAPLGRTALLHVIPAHELKAVATP
ncbi:DUF6603 domain-containing protein [Streptomyces sp. NPDC001868]|uniref:DUF6603 domain-containing protein n=1 Tax=Streptomyces sp. NPDC001868 TaxID=3154401 RepID=UPI00331D1EEF